MRTDKTEPSHMGKNNTADDLAHFVLNHPGMSQWLKTTLAGAMECEPFAVLNDIEILAIIMRLRT